LSGSFFTHKRGAAGIGGVAIAGIWIGIGLGSFEGSFRTFIIRIDDPDVLLKSSITGSCSVMFIA
jgi:hypothetical protein